MLKNIHKWIEKFLLSPAYFILFGIYPVFRLYVHNVHGVLVTDLFRPLIISLFLALLFFRGLKLITRDSQRSALLVFLIYFSFFNYGDVRNSLINSQVAFRDEILALVWLLLTILLFFLIFRYGQRWDAKSVAVGMNLMTIILLLFPLTRLIVYNVVSSKPLERKIDHTIQVSSSSSPDIYYIILDAYTRSDVLMNNFGYDNRSFINSLQNMGFYVAECSQSNYGMTSLSLSSSLNLDYLQNISDAFQSEEGDLLYSIKALNSNAFRDILTNAGYKTVSFSSGFTWAEWRDAEYFMFPPEKGISEFEVVVLLSTYARTIEDFGFVNLDDIHAEHYRRRTRFVLDSFDEVLKLPSPKFVFIHIIAPHEPYGLDENGNDIMPDQIDAVSGYENQARFISTAILSRLQNLINNSATPPVIILQGDHGMLGGSPQDLMKILNAYYLPGHEDQLYPSISPINTFRVILNSYFGTNFPLLEDVSYYSTLSQKYDFKIIPNTCP